MLFSISLDPEIFYLGTFIQKPGLRHSEERAQVPAPLRADAVDDDVYPVLDSSPGE